METFQTYRHLELKGDGDPCNGSGYINNSIGPTNWPAGSPPKCPGCFRCRSERSKRGAATRAANKLKEQKVKKAKKRRS